MSVLTRLRLALAWRQRPWSERFRLARAQMRRKRLSDTVFVGVTGSVGKTTTKDLAVSVLARAGATAGNRMGLNYLDDVARAMLTIRRDHRFGVFEIATSGPGTIDARVDLVRPSIAAMIIVGRDHIKNFGSMEAIAEEKAKLIWALPKDGTAVLNVDDPLVRKVGERVSARRIWFGSSPEADLRLIDATSSYPDPLTLRLEFKGQTHTCVTGVHGTHLTVPVLAAVGIGLAAGMRIEECIAALKDAPTTPGRMQIVNCTDGVTFVRDDFKAPHWSFQMALDYLRDARAARKVAIIGTLSDYSLSASKLYPKVARAAREVADLVVFVGPHALRALKARSGTDDQALVGFTEIEDAHRFLQDELRAGDLVLIKASNHADHLVRLVLARSQPVSCWIRDCGKNRFCDACPQLDQPSSSQGGSESASPTQPRVEGVGLNPAADGGSGDSAVGRSDAILVVGLGNPGEKYSGTPHNVGFDVLDAMVRQRATEWGTDPDGMICRTEIAGKETVLFKSAAAINLTGPVVDRVRQRLGVQEDRIIVVHDDADLEIGRVRIKKNGSDGGHKGLRSVFAALRNDGFMPRVRVGVRASRDAEAMAKSLVLQRFESEDGDLVQQGLRAAAVAVDELIGEWSRSGRS